MGQYDELVRKQKLMLEAEKWAKKVKYILGDNNGFVVAFNDGSKKITMPNGRTHITEAEMSLEDCITRMKEEKADADRFRR